MATTNEKLVSLDLLYFFKTLQDEQIANGDAPAYKAYELTDGILKLYRTTDKSDTPDAINIGSGGSVTISTEDGNALTLVSESGKEGLYVAMASDDEVAEIFTID